MNIANEKAWERARELKGTRRGFHDFCLKEGVIPKGIVAEHAALKRYMKTLQEKAEDNSDEAPLRLGAYLF